eukprot:COSAG06_NODE_64745_length_258_cov_1.949686_1_plen_33_part_01
MQEQQVVRLLLLHFRCRSRHHESTTSAICKTRQ